ncbi:MAG: helix-turn-helix domain-containing protein [Phycisphaerae bacterium]
MSESPDRSGHLPQLVAVGHIFCPPGPQVSPDGHEFHELVLIIQGQYRVRDAEGEHVLEPGELVYYPPGTPHFPGIGESEELELFFVDWLESEDRPRREKTIRAVDHHGRIQSLVKWMANLVPPPSKHQQHVLNCLLEGLLFEFDEVCSNSDHELVDRLRAYMHARMANPISLDDLARVARMSKYHFCRVFGEAAGVPPMRFLRNMRVEKARVMLLTTSLPHKAIAEKVGLRNEANLYRVFREVTGMSPSDLRKGAIIEKLPH